MSHTHNTGIHPLPVASSQTIICSGEAHTINSYSSVTDQETINNSKVICQNTKQQHIRRNKAPCKSQNTAKCYNSAAFTSPAQQSVQPLDVW